MQPAESKTLANLTLQLLQTERTLKTRTDDPLHPRKHTLLPWRSKLNIPQSNVEPGRRRFLIAKKPPSIGNAARKAIGVVNVQLPRKNNVSIENRSRRLLVSRAPPTRAPIRRTWNLLVKMCIYHHVSNWIAAAPRIWQTNNISSLLIVILPLSIVLSKALEEFSSKLLVLAIYIVIRILSAFTFGVLKDVLYVPNLGRNLFS